MLFLKIIRWPCLALEIIAVKSHILAASHNKGNWEVKVLQNLILKQSLFLKMMYLFIAKVGAGFFHLLVQSSNALQKG